MRAFAASRSTAVQYPFNGSILKTNEARSTATALRFEKTSCLLFTRTRSQAGLSLEVRVLRQPMPESRRKPDPDFALSTLRFRCSSEFLKASRTSCAETGDAYFDLGRYARNRTPSNAWARKIPAPIRPINAVTISIIANILCEPRENQTTWHPAQSKGFPNAKPESESTEDSAQQHVPYESNNRRISA
jgi:hypothetical protein